MPPELPEGAGGEVVGPLRPHARNVTSQYGEDGMLEWLFDRLDVGRGWCVEVGAWDGVHLSNTWNLWHEHGWHAVLIEAGRRRHRRLARETAGFPAVTAVHARVRPVGAERLDALLEGTGAPRELDLLSVDVDGEEYRIWQGLEQFRPTVVVLEYNCSIPPWVDYVQPPGGAAGASARALERLARDKGYRLVDLTLTNLVFLAGEQAARVPFPLPRLEDLFDVTALPVVFSDYDGTHHVVRPGPWGYAGTHLADGIGKRRLRRLRRLARRLDR